jgi:hypothetical protein
VGPFICCAVWLLLHSVFSKGDCSAPKTCHGPQAIIIIISSSSVVVVVVIVRGGGEAVVVVHVVVGCKMSKAVLRHWLYKSGGGGDGSIMQSCLWRS